MEEIKNISYFTPDLADINDLFQNLMSIQIDKIQLKKELSFYKTLLNPPNTIIYMNDVIKKKKVYCNENYNRITGYTMEEANSMGEDYFKLTYHEEDKNIFFKSLDSIKSATNSNEWHGVYRFKTKFGYYIWFYSRGYIYKYDTRDKPWLTIGIGLDITDRIKGETPLNKVMEENLSLKYKVLKELLTSREKKILKLISKGLSSNSIAGKVCLSVHTVETHRKNILNKLELKNTAELIRMASYSGLI